jgi:hypothetical protein
VPEPFYDLDVGARQRSTLNDEVDEVFDDPGCRRVERWEHPPSSFGEAPWLPVVLFNPEPLHLAVAHRVPDRLEAPDNVPVAVGFGERFQVLGLVAFPVGGNDRAGMLRHVGAGEQRAVVGDFTDDGGRVR